MKLVFCICKRKGHLCGDHPHNILVAKLVRTKVKVVDALECVLDGGE